MGNAVKKSMLFILLDESGSMLHLRSDVIAGINSFITEQRKLPNPAVIAIADFGSHIPGMIRVVRPMQDLKEVPLLTEVDYIPTGGTPLLDATGQSIQGLDVDWAREKPDRCVFVTFTDGAENASKEFSVTKIKSLVEAREKSGLWNFLFLGANIDSFWIGEKMGYTSSKTANYGATTRGFAAAGQTVSHSVGTLRNASNEVFTAAAAGSANIGMGGDIQEDGSVTNLQQGLGSGGIGSAATPSSGMPPAASMTQESWTPPTSSALFDPKVESWKPPSEVQ